MLFAALVALLVYLPIGCAAVAVERLENWAPRQYGFTPGDHRQYKRWLP